VKTDGIHNSSNKSYLFDHYTIIHWPTDFQSKHSCHLGSSIYCTLAGKQWTTGKCCEQHVQ